MKLDYDIKERLSINENYALAIVGVILLAFIVSIGIIGVSVYAKVTQNVAVYKNK